MTAQSFSSCLLMPEPLSWTHTRPFMVLPWLAVMKVICKQQSNEGRPDRLQGPAGLSAALPPGCHCSAALGSSRLWLNWMLGSLGHSCAGARVGGNPGCDDLATECTAVQSAT